MAPDRGEPFRQGDKATRKYLSQHAEPENLLAPQVASDHGPFGHGLAIPAQAEGTALAHRIACVPPGPKGPILIVAVVNACADASREVLDSNRHSLEGVQARFGLEQHLAPGISVHEHPTGRLILIDRSHSKPLPTKQGVGLARKIGCDFLLRVMECGAIASPWLHCSDADTRLPTDYFAQAVDQAEKNATALHYHFRHRPDKSEPATYPIAQASESSLRYYVLGLRFAGSTHAFHSVGSALALHGNAYAQVRGFPRREAAEDFYILNKLAKLGAIQSLKGTPIEPSSRASNRVPFGTGAAIQKLQRAPKEQIQVYHPQVFRYLKTWEATLARCRAQPRLAQDLSTAVATQASTTPGVESRRLLQALTASDTLARAQRAFNGPTATISQALCDNLDAFRTLRLIHALRDTGLGTVGLREALDQAPFLDFTEGERHLPIGEIATRFEQLDGGPLKVP
ncbi:MAG: glycosyltransferase family 2 protein [Myxococcota bacterium]|nr:glycosyltransferase family 2 protein [Myxococcota bacterium]